VANRDKSFFTAPFRIELAMRKAYIFWPKEHVKIIFTKISARLSLHNVGKAHVNIITNYTIEIAYKAYTIKRWTSSIAKKQELRGLQG
jgi:UDP-galactopyranose mutase